MPQVNPSLPIVGQPDSTEDPKIVTALSTLIAAVNTVDSAQISPTAGITDGQLASPTSPVWRPILTADAGAPSSLASGTNYWFSGPTPVASGSPSPISSGVPVLWLPSTAADVAVAGKTTRLRLRVVLVVNATAPGVNITPALYQVNSLAGGSGNIAPTLGTVAMSALFTTPALGSGAQAVSSTVDLSTLNAGALYCFGVAVSGPPAAGSACILHMALEIRHT